MKKKPKIKIGEVPMHFMTMPQVAAFVGRHPVTLRKYYSQGVLPEPENSYKEGTRIVRRFTIAEAEKLRVLFDNMEYGTLAKRRVGGKKR